MLVPVLARAEHNKVGGAIVGAVLIDVVDVVTAWNAVSAFGDEPVLQVALAASAVEDVALAVAVGPVDEV